MLKAIPMGGGDGLATVELAKDDRAVMTKLAARTLSDPTANRTTGAELGAGSGAGRITDEDMGSAKDVTEAAEMAAAKTPEA